MSTPADKLRKLMALAADPSTTAGERAGCQAAIERIKKTMPLAEFAKAKAQAKAANNPRAEAMKDKARRQQAEKEARFDQWRAAQQAREKVSRFSHSQAAALKAFEEIWQELNRQARGAAYPSAYGDRRK